MNLFLDSSLIVEHIKGNRPENDLLEHLLGYDFDLLISPIIFSEVMFNFLTIHAGKSGLAIKKSKAIGSIMSENNPMMILKNFKFVNPQYDLQVDAIRLMRSYNLLPNDALILSHCISSDFKYVASYDSDFIIPCQQEGITLINSIETFNREFSTV